MRDIPRCEFEGNVIHCFQCTNNLPEGALYTVRVRCVCWGDGRLGWAGLRCADLSLTPSRLPVLPTWQCCFRLSFAASV